MHFRTGTYRSHEVKETELSASALVRHRAEQYALDYIFWHFLSYISEYSTQNEKREIVE